MVQESQMYQDIAAASSVLLSVAGLIQISACLSFATRLHLLHLVLQVTTSLWAILTGIICLPFACAWKFHLTPPLQVLQVRAVLLFHLVLEITTLSIVIMDTAGFKIGLKTALSRYLLHLGIEPPQHLPKVGILVLTSGGTVALLMAITRLLCTMSCAQGDDRLRKELDPSARRIYKGGSPMLCYTPQNPSMYNQQMSSTPLQSNKSPTAPLPARRSFQHCFGTLRKAESAKAKSPLRCVVPFRSFNHNDHLSNTYIRFYEDDDIPVVKSRSLRLGSFSGTSPWKVLVVTSTPLLRCDLGETSDYVTVDTDFSQDRSEEKPLDVKKTNRTNSSTEYFSAVSSHLPISLHSHQTLSIDDPEESTLP